jgi:hypothetical protein
MPTFWQDDTRKDPLVVADLFATDWFAPYKTDRFATFRLGHINSVNSPYGNGDTDFFYHMYKLADGYWITLTAYDVRSRAIFTNSKVNGDWQGWQEIQKIEYALADAPIVDVPFPLSEGSFSNIRIRNGVYHLVGRYISSTPIAITEGMIIGRLRQDYYINPTWNFCVNVHNFLNE